MERLPSGEELDWGGAKSGILTKGGKMRWKAFTAIWAVGFIVLGTPLFEPAWSPVLLPHGAKLPWLDNIKALLIADLDGDNVGELVLGGDYLHHYYLSKGELRSYYLPVFLDETYKPLGRPGGGVMGVRALAAGDLGRVLGRPDGLLDLVVATEKELWVLMNHGPWGFQPAPGSPHPVSCDLVWVFDLNADGLSDVVGAAGRRALFLRRNTRGGGLAAPVDIEGVSGWIITGSPGLRGFYFLTAEGVFLVPTGSTKAEKVLEGEWKAFEAADLDRDGQDDLILGRRGEIQVYFGEGGGFGKPVSIGIKEDASWIGVGDFDGNGLLDIVAGCGSPGGFTLIHNLGGRQFLDPFFQGVHVPLLKGFPAMAFGFALGDLDGDRRDDLVILTHFHLAFFLSGGPGRALLSIPGSFLLGKADMDGDGLEDLLCSTVEGGVAALLNTGYGFFKEKELVGPSGEDRMPYIARVGDVTGDGVAELVVYELAEESWAYQVWEKGKMVWKQERSQARITAWDLQNPKEPLWSIPLGMGPRPVLFLVDLDGDGINEAVSSVGYKVVGVGFNLLAKDKAWWERMKRVEVPVAGLVGPLALLHFPSGPVLAGLSLTTKAELFLVREGRIEETGVALEVAPLDLVAADLNADGNDDLALIGWGAEKEEGKEPRLSIFVAILLGDGKGNFTPKLFPIPDWPPLCMPFPYGGLAVGDFDADGDLDLAAMRLPDQEGNPGGVVVLPWEGEGLGNPVFLDLCVGTELFALDVNKDGKDEPISVQLGTPALLCLVNWR